MPGRDHVRAPGAEVLDAARARVRIVDVDPVVRERLGLSRHERDEAEVAVAQLGGRLEHVRGWRRLEDPDEVLEREARHDPVDRVLGLVRVGVRQHAGARARPDG